ncbi:hypothetical protein [Streptomyces alboniger]|nr:hypothetical protein [Streptomyces alboniger]
MRRTPLGDESEDIAESDTSDDHRNAPPRQAEGYEMFEYEMYQMRAADLAREADRRRLIREARGNRAAARRSGRDEAEGRVSVPLWRSRFTRAA